MTCEHNFDIAYSEFDAQGVQRSLDERKTATRNLINRGCTSELYQLAASTYGPEGWELPMELRHEAVVGLAALANVPQRRRTGVVSITVSGERVQVRISNFSSGPSRIRQEAQDALYEIANSTYDTDGWEYPSEFRDICLQNL